MIYNKIAEIAKTFFKLQKNKKLAIRRLQIFKWQYNKIAEIAKTFFKLQKYKKIAIKS